MPTAMIEMSEELFEKIQSLLTTNKMLTAISALRKATSGINCKLTVAGRTKVIEAIGAGNFTHYPKLQCYEISLSTEEETKSAACLICGKEATFIIAYTYNEIFRAENLCPEHLARSINIFINDKETRIVGVRFTGEG